jgi:hypothetical protein
MAKSASRAEKSDADAAVTFGMLPFIVPFTLLMSMFSFVVLAALKEGLKSFGLMMKKSQIDLLKKFVVPYISQIVAHVNKVFPADFTPNATQVRVVASMLSAFTGR